MLHSKKHHINVLAAVVLLLLALLSAANYRAAERPLLRLARSEIAFEEFVDEVQSGYIANSFKPRNSFVNLNGLFARLTGRRVLNKIVRCENGMLTLPMAHVDITNFAQSIVDFSEYLNEYEDIPFLYVQMPYKEDLDEELLPEGVVGYANESTDALLDIFQNNGVHSLDIRPQVSQTTELLEQYFYRTDHHWNPEGAFVAFQEILKELQEMFPEGNIDLDYTRKELWERHEKENWMLGSRGKRVGQFFGGTDSLIWLTPRFETEMSYSAFYSGDLCKGDFTTANIRTQYIERRDYFEEIPYFLYIGNNYPLGQHRNLAAPSALRVLIIKDSFSLPLEAYLSTVFQEVDALDPRELEELNGRTIAEHIAWTRPDVVIFAINPGAFTNKKYQEFGVAGARQAYAQEGEYVIVEQQDIELNESDTENNYAAIPLEQNSVYKVTFDDVEVLTGETDGVGIQLYNRATNKNIDNVIFDLAYCEARGEFTWTFHTPETEDDLQLLFYAGIYGHTAGNSVVYRNVQLEKWGAA